MSRLTPPVRMILGLLVVIVAVVALLLAGNGLATRHFEAAGLPITFMLPSAPDTSEPLEPAAEPGQAPRHEPQSLPGVIVAHGFAGSSRIMLGYAHALAHAGYAVLLPDLSGHGDNDHRFDGNELALAAEIHNAYEALLRQPEVDPGRVALVGHSMGSMAVLAAALESPERYRATVAISPGRVEVTPLTPRNLQLQAGAAEPRFLRNAEHLLELAGGASADFANGRARELVPVRGAEHLTILFRDASHAAVIRWLDVALGHASGPRAYRDRRILWWLALVCGSLLALSSAAPQHTRHAVDENRIGLIRRPLHWVGVLLAPAAGAVVCALLGTVVDLRSVAGMPIGGAMALWMLVSGLIFLGVAFRPHRPARRDLTGAIGAFVFLWLVFGLTAEFVWLTWGLVSPRALRWPLLALACTPWFLAAELAQGDPQGKGRLVWWLLQSLSLSFGLLLLMRLTTGLGWIALVLPLLPPILALLGCVGSRFNRPWTYGLAAGAFFGWLIVATFPLLG